MARRLFLFLGAILAPLWFAASALATPADPTNPVFSFVGSSSLAVDFQATPGPTIQFTVELSSTAGTLFSSTTVMLSSTFTALDVNQEFFARVQAEDTFDSSFSGWSTIISTYTLANDPLSLSTTSISFSSVDLTWDANGNPNGTIFVVERSSDSVSFTSIVSQTQTTYSDISSTAGINYQYRVYAVNNLNVPTGYSNTILVTTPGNASVPRTVPGLTATRTQTGGSTFQIDFTWHAVTERTDGTTLANLTAYDIYSSTSLLTPRGQWTLLTSVGTESASVISNGSVSYYTWKTRDSNGQTSDWSAVLDDSSDLNHFYLGADSISRIQLPASAARVLLRSGNRSGSDLDITLTEVSSEETGRIIRSMQFAITNYDTGSEVTDVTFDPPVLRGTIAYTVQNGEVVAGAPSGIQLRVPVVAAAQAADQLSLFWHNGNDWVKTTGLVNTADNTISFTGSRVGRYQIREASHVSGLVMTRAYPRIITPNDDGWNDKAIFEFDNPELTQLSGHMYDLSNALVAELAPGPNPGTTLIWDGKDSKGKPVPGGIYLYSIEQGSGKATGTVVVAR